MNKITKNLAEWQKCIDQYKSESIKIQKRISRSLRTIWLQSENYKKCDVQKLIDDSGRSFLLQPTLNKF